MNKNELLAISLVAVAILAGCATPDRNARLEDARSSYNDAKSNPQVVNLAALELKEAGDALSKANNAWDQRQDSATVDHLAYLAQRRVAIAQESAKRKSAEADVSQAEAERDKVRLAARTQEADRAQQQARELEQQLNELNAKQTDRGLVITLGDVLFDTDQAQLKSGGAREMQKLADVLKQNPQRTVFIEGFTDSTGSDSHNQELSERRANAVRDTLLNLGISGDRITTRGYGKNFPIASNANKAGRLLNRRVEIVISDQSGNIRSR